MAETSRKTPFSEEELRKIAKKKILRSMAFRIHFSAFICVNIALVLINYLTNHFSTPWFVYPLAGWWIGLAEHGAAYLIYSRGVIGAPKIGLIMHAVAYIAAAPALFVINLFSSPIYPWFLWPVCFWSLGLVIHAVAVRSFGIKREETGEKKSWLDRKIEYEVGKASTQQGGI
jgi:hypothetical protein